MCDDPYVEESTLTVADTPAVRQVLARWLAYPDDVAPEVYVARGLAAAGYDAEPYAPGVYAVTPRASQPDGYMFGQLWQVFRALAPHVVATGPGGQPPHIQWRYCDCGEAFRWVVLDGAGHSWDPSPDGTFVYPYPRVYEFEVVTTERTRETVEVDSATAAELFADPQRPTRDELHRARVDADCRVHTTSVGLEVHLMLENLTVDPAR